MKEPACVAVQVASVELTVKVSSRFVYMIILNYCTGLSLCCMIL